VVVAYLKQFNCRDLGKPRKTPDNMSPGRVLNPRPSEYEAGVLTRAKRSVLCVFFMLCKPRTVTGLSRL
jgi:hypothetical protein